MQNHPHHEVVVFVVGGGGWVGDPAKELRLSFKPAAQAHLILYCKVYMRLHNQDVYKSTSTFQVGCANSPHMQCTLM